MPNLSGPPGANYGRAGAGLDRYVTVGELVNAGLLDGSAALGGPLSSPNAANISAPLRAALESRAASIQMNSATLFKRMNGLAGVVFGSAGIAGYNSSGASSFTLDTETGLITAVEGFIGGFTLGATTMTATSGGNTTIVSSGATAFTAGPTGSPTVTITQGGNITIVGGGTFNTTGYVKATGGVDGGNGLAAINGFPSTANYHGGSFWATGTGNGVIGVATGSGDGGRFSNTLGTGAALSATGNTSSAAVIVTAGAGQQAVWTLGGVTAGTFTGALSGNATTATTLQTGRNIGGVSFNGSANIVPITTANNGGAAHTYSWTGGAVAGAATATFPGNDKPGSNTSNSWLTFIVDTTTFYVPAWT